MIDWLWCLFTGETPRGTKLVRQPTVLLLLKWRVQTQSLDQNRTMKETLEAVMTGYVPYNHASIHVCKGGLGEKYVHCLFAKWLCFLLVSVILNCLKKYPKIELKIPFQYPILKFSQKKLKQHWLSICILFLTLFDNFPCVSLHSNINGKQKQLIRYF